MSADGDDDDAQLKQLRAVWVSMREEDPPGGGLAALMAAAREKADEMKDRPADAAPSAEPGWWSKLLAALRRPPVLALASVAVLVGGVLVLSNRDKGIGPSSESVAIAPEPPMQTQPNVEGTVQEAPPRELETPTPGRRGPARTAGKGTASAGSAASITEEQKPPPGKMTEPPPEKMTEPPRKPTEAPVTPDSQRGPTRAPVKKPAVEQVDVPSGGFGGRTTTDGEVANPTAKPTADMDRGEASKDVAKDAANDAGNDTTKAGMVKADAAKPTLAQLIAQCEKAAQTGDCAAVRALAARIKVGDARAYRQRVMGNASIARCLEVRAAE